MWERFFNWQSDLDWTWGPFLALRPARKEPMPLWVWARLFLALSAGGLLLIGLAALGCVLGPKVAASQHWRVPPGLSETLGILAAMAADPGLRLTAIALFLCLPLLFFAFCLPFHAAWNRRAQRLSAAADLQIEEAKAERKKGVWPPAPMPPRR